MLPTDPHSVATEVPASWARGDFDTTRALLTEEMTTDPEATVPTV